MGDQESTFASLGLLLIAVSALIYVIQVLYPKPWCRHVAWTSLLLAVISLITSLIFRSIQADYFALSNMYEALLVCTLGLTIAYLVIERWFHIHNLGWVVCLFALVMLFYAGSMPLEISPLQPALRSYWRAIHVPPLLLSYGFFTLAFLSSVAFLVSNKGNDQSHRGGKLANREGGPVLSFSHVTHTDLYDEVTYRCIAVGFPLLLIGTVLGALWANEAWGNYWSWDPKESMALVTLLGYGAYLHMRINGDHARTTLAWVSVIGFLLVLMTFVGVNVWGFGSLHSYGSVS